jgi:hypothetical protein
MTLKTLADTNQDLLTISGQGPNQLFKAFFTAQRFFRADLTPGAADRGDWHARSAD